MRSGRGPARRASIQGVETVSRVITTVVPRATNTLIRPKETVGPIRPGRILPIRGVGTIRPSRILPIRGVGTSRRKALAGEDGAAWLRFTASKQRHNSQSSQYRYKCF